MLPVTAGSIMETVAALLNDTDRQVYTDAVILPYIQLAMNDLSLKLEDYNIAITNITSEPITITAGVLDIGGDSGPALPQDLVEILSISERTAGTTNDFAMMSRRQFIPETDIRTAYLQVWSWQDQIVKFIGANGDIEVKLNYIGNTAGAIIDESSLIKFFNAQSYLQYRTAGHCAMYIGENQARATTLYLEAEDKLDSTLNIGIKSTQGIRTRRRPFRARFKSNGSYPQ